LRRESPGHTPTGERGRKGGDSVPPDALLHFLAERQERGDQELVLLVVVLVAHDDLGLGLGVSPKGRPHLLHTPHTRRQEKEPRQVLQPRRLGELDEAALDEDVQVRADEVLVDGGDEGAQRGGGEVGEDAAPLRM
jgi:hypothetical protein